MKNFIQINQLFVFLTLLTIGYSISSRFLPASTNCPPAYYYNTTNQTCNECNSTLKYCMACESASNCTLCIPGSVLTNGKCVPNCSEGQYAAQNLSSSQVCESCMSNCKSCTKYYQCSECESNYTWNASMKSCMAPHGCSSSQFYNVTSQTCGYCESAITACNTCLNASYCTSCYGPYSEAINGSCGCAKGTFKDSNQTYNYSIDCTNCTQNCKSCDNLTSCNECDDSFTWNSVTQLCSASMIDLTSNFSNSTVQVIYWDLSLNTTGIEQQYQLEVEQALTPGAFYWTKNAILPEVYVSTNCSNGCQGFDISQPPSKTNYCFTNAGSNETSFTVLTDSNISSATCILQFYIPNNYTLNQSYNFYYDGIYELETTESVVYYGINSSFYRYLNYNLTGMNNITNAAFQILLTDIDSNQKIGDFYLGTTDISANCDFKFPSDQHHCSGVQVQNKSGNQTEYSYTTRDPNANFYIAMSLSNPSKYTYLDIDFYVTLICDSGYYQPNYYVEECLQIINETTNWDLDLLGTQWANTTQSTYSFQLNFTPATNNIYSFTLPTAQQPGTFYLFFQEEKSVPQSIYISSNCSVYSPSGTGLSFCAGENFTSTPSYNNYCSNAILTNMWNYNMIKGEQCMFYFSIPSAAVDPEVQFAYFPQLELLPTQNYTNILIPWSINTPALQYFTYQLPDSASNNLYQVTISQLNIAVIDRLQFSSNGPAYQDNYCNATFPQSYTISQCHLTKSNYSQGIMDYDSYTFQINAGSKATFGFMTKQNGSYNNFSFSSNYAQSCSTGQFYNYTSSSCGECSAALTNCEACASSRICTECSNSRLTIVKGSCVANCSEGFYPNPNITSNTTEICFACSLHCSQCDSQYYCNKCQSPFSLNQSTGTCQNQSLVCPSGQYLNGTSQQCVNCSQAIQGCQLCSSSTNCTQCYSGLTLNYSVCTCPRGQYSNPNTTSSTLCLDCMEHCNKCYNGTGCISCESSYTWNATSQSCQQQSTPTCKSGQYYNSSQAICVSCMSNCLSCVNSTTCQTCASSYVWNDTSQSCQQQSTPTCTSGQYYNSSSATCVSCMLNCLNCSNSTNCNECAQTYTWNTTSQSCQHQNTSTCTSGQYYNSSQATCVSCMPNCLSCVNSTTCQTCASSYVWNDTSQSCQQYITVTDLTSDVTYKSTGDYWNLTLQMKNQPQIFQLKVYQEYMPGSFYWAKGSVYPTVYVSTNCTTQHSCSYLNSSEVSPTNYCVKTPSTNDTAWALTTDVLNASECRIQFYVAGNYSNNDTLNFMYFPQKEVQIGSNQADFNWQPNLNRYFRYSFIANGTNSVNTFTIQTNNSLNGIYFGTSASAAQCNYPLPNKTSQCSNVSVNSSSSGMMYSLTFTSNAVIYFAISAGGNAYIPFVISTQGSQQHAYYNWDLTNLSTNWMSGNQVYWSLELNYTTNMTNNYKLKLNTDSSQHQTPGTIYIFYNLNNSLQTAYVSTNCSTVEVCNNQTDTPSADNYCWVAGQNSIWSMNTQETFGQCYFYFSIPELTVAPQANFAFLPQLNLSGTQNYTGLPIPWVFQTEQFFTYEIPATYQYYNETKGYYNITISGLNTNFVKYMYFSTNDPFYNSSCISNFPESSSSCFENASTYSANNTNYLSYSFNVSLTSSKIVLGFLTQQYESIKYFDFSSNYTFGCRERYILNNGTCEREQTADLTNASTPVSNSTTPDKKYWNVTIDPTQSTEEEQFYTLELETVNFPGTFYLSSQFLDTVYITTDCNSTMPCKKFTEFPEAQKYCFTQQSGNNGIFINNYEKNSSSNCQFDFTFQNSTNSNGVVQMQYFPLQNFTDTNNLSIYIPSQTVAMPRFTQYTLPISKSAAVPAYFDYYTIKISNIPNALISDIYYSTDDSSSASTECKLTEFPDQNTICSFTKISQSTDLFEIEFNIASVSSHHYIAFYTKQADSEKYLNLVVSSATQCQTGYYYSETSKKCEEQQTTCNEGQFYNTKTSECALCSTALSYCSKCSSTGEYCTECNKGNGGQITLTNGHCLVTCQSGKYPNPNEAQTALCLDCMEHCVQCKNADSCTECYEPTFKWNDKTSTCDSVCDDGKYYDIKSNSCVNCEVSQCTVCYGAGKQCHSCSKGYKLEASGSNGNTCKKDAFQLQIGLAAFFLLLILLFKEY